MKEKNNNHIPEFEKLFKKLKQRPPKDLDKQVLRIHHQVSDEIDCLTCANCCKTTGPMFTSTDIERISGYLKIKPQAFVERYLRKDEDGDTVFQTLPCPFLDENNYCWIYQVRPKACREYPHTDRKKIYQISKITIKNTQICPIAHQVVKRIEELYMR